jgi:hypothetical protein
LLFIGVAMSMLTFVSGQNLLETNDNLREIAMTAKQEVAACHGRLIGWDKPNPRVVYYYGQNIPAANAVVKKLRAQFGKAEGLFLWKLWLHKPTEPALLVERLGSKKEVQRFVGHGFEVMPCTPLPKDVAQNTDDKMSDKLRVPVLLKPDGSGQVPEPAPETPTDRE